MSPQKQLIKTAMAKVCHSGRPELFTMFLCLIGSKGMNFDLAWLQFHSGELTAARQAVEKKFRMPPTPLFCCLSVSRGGAGQLYDRWPRAVMEVRGGQAVRGWSWRLSFVGAMHNQHACSVVC